MILAGKKKIVRIDRVYKNCNVIKRFKLILKLKNNKINIQNDAML